MTHRNAAHIKLRNVLRKFRSDEGSVTVEMVLWLPVFLIVMAVMVDVSLMFLRHGNLSQVAKDTARQVSLNQLQTEEAAEAYAARLATLANDSASADVTIDESIASNKWVEVSVWVPIREVGVFGIMNIGGNRNLTATVVHHIEQLSDFESSSDSGVSEAIQ